MKIQAIKTRKFLPPKDNLWELLEESLPKLEENSIVIVTSKIVSIAEGRCVSLNGISKDDLAKKEADFFLERDEVPGKWFLHTLKNNPDSLASAAVFTMGEGSEQTPIAIISELSSMVKFSERHPADNGKGFLVTLKDDLFY